jgi:hypothetical protein
MKKLLFLTIVLLFSVSAISQVVNIPDANFKSILLANTAINTNADEEIQVLEAESYSGSLNIDRSKGVINDFIGLEAFLNLSELGLEGHEVNTLNLSKNSKIEKLYLSSFPQIKSLIFPENSSIYLIHIMNIYSLQNFDFSNLSLLKDLDINMGNNLTIDISKNTKLERLAITESTLNSLNLSNNKLLQTLLLDMSTTSENLDFSNLINLKTFSFKDAWTIGQLDFSNNINLTQLDISAEDFSSLNIKNGNNKNLSLSVSSPVLKCVIVDDPTWSAQNWSTKFPQGTQFSLDCIPEPVVNIPDANFKSILLANAAINTNADEEIQVSEAEAFTGKLIINESDISPITSLEGLEAFIGIKELRVIACSELPSIDVSKNVNLEILSLSDTNNISSLDVSQNKLLKTLGVINTNIGGFMDLSVNTELELVGFEMTGISGIDVTNCKMLKTLGLSMSGVSELDVTQNEALEVLDISYTSLQAIDLSKNMNFKNLTAEGMVSLVELDLSNNSLLTRVICNGEQFAKINLKNGNNKNITELSVAQNQSFPFSECVIVDDPTWSKANWSSKFPQGTQFSLDCIPEPVVNIPDTNFKSRLLINQQLNKNLDNEIQVSEAESYSSVLFIGDADITDLTGIEYFKNITELNCNFNNISSIDLTGFDKLVKLNCERNNLSELDLSKVPSLESVRAGYNKLSKIDFTGLTNLLNLNMEFSQISAIDLKELVNIKDLNLKGNTFQTLDLSNNKNLEVFNASMNNQLTSLNLKNGSNIKTFDMTQNFVPNLKYICADEEEILTIKNALKSSGSSNCEVNSYCSFTPGGEFYTLQGSYKNCSGEGLLIPNLKYQISDGKTTGIFISNKTGNYNITLQKGSYTITPIIEQPDYFAITPSSINIQFPTENSLPLVQDFCVSPKDVHSDMEITLLPLEPVRPGFDFKAKIIFKNKGNQTESGNIILTYDDTVLDFITSSIAVRTSGTNELKWKYSNIQPFETREIIVEFNVNSPMENPAVNGGDILKLKAEVFVVNTDETPKDNVFELYETVVNSFDPNDKTCLEGEVITPDMIGNYLHYKIRFENTGTFFAENVVIEDDIDTTKFDLSSLVVLEGSHSFVTKIEGNKVKFIFEKINLPFDDATNDGYVLFKIKTLPSLKLNDSFSNSAKIHFDFNFPIETNLATTTVKETIVLSVKDFEFSDQFNLYPNPTNNELNISAKTKSTITSIEIYNTIGQILLAVPNAQNTQKIDVSFLPNGTYILKTNTTNGVSIVKFVKE